MPSSLRRRFWSAQSCAAPYLFVLPFAALFCCFTIYPLAQSVAMSLYQTAGPREARFVGAGNFTFMLSDFLFWQSVLNTVLFAVLYIPLLVGLSLGLAILLNDPRVRFRNVFRFAFFSSYLVGSVFVAIIFMLLLAPRTGLINRAIGAALPWVGSETNWRGDPRFAMPAIVAAALWLTVGQAMIYLLAALQAVDQSLYEAAEVDGAGPWQRFRHITLPGIRPVLSYLVLVSTIYAMQLFELPYVFFQGFGPRFSGLTVVGYLFLNGFQASEIGYAAAVGCVLVVLTSIVAFLQLRVSGATRELDG